jgi:hypothetical protein
MGEKRCVYKVLIGDSGTKRKLVTPRCGWKDNVKKGLKEIEWEDIDCIIWLKI